MKRSIYLFLFLLLFGLLAACSPTATSTESAAEVSPETTDSDSTAAETESVANSEPTATAVSEPTLALSPEELQEAIFAAVREDDTAAMAQYIAAGADITQPGDMNVTVLSVAALRGNIEMIDLLLETGATITADEFCNAVLGAEGNVDLVNTFIAHGVDVNEAESGAPQHTPLMHAAESGDIAVGLLLLENGADINAVDMYNDPALNVAAFHGNLEFVQMLVEQGAELSIAGYGGRTAVGHATNRGHDEVVAYLESVGAE